jgi:hypothetical protein
MMQLNEIESIKEIDALEQHLRTQIEKMNIPCKTNEMLEQLKENQMLLMITQMHEIRFTRNLVKEMSDALNE